MKLTCSNRRNDAMTRTEVVVVVAIIAVLIVVVLPALIVPDGRITKDYCVSNLKQIGIAFRVWEGDNNDKYPTQVGSAEGGAMELAATGNVARVFQVMSNELSTPKVLICPMDTSRHWATDFTTNFGSANISYFVGLDAADQFTNSILTGDDNLAIQGTPVKSGVLELSTNSPIAWTAERHRFSGNIGLADGSVSALKNSELAGTIIKQYAGPSGFTNRFRIAIP